MTKEVKMEETIMNEDLHDELAQETCISGKVDTSRRRGVWNTYLQKTYLMTASHMGKGARFAVVPSG